MPVSQRVCTSNTMTRSRATCIQLLHQYRSRPITCLAGYHRGCRALATTPPPPSPSPIHILGLGSIGTFAAHTLAEIPARPPVTLLLHRQSLIDEYRQCGKQIALETNEGDLVKYGDYNLELLNGTNRQEVVLEPESPDLLTNTTQNNLEDTIQHLIVSVKSTQTVAALRPLLPRLIRTSSILFLQNGAGMIEDVNDLLWPNPYTRPNYITGVISHGVTLKSPFSIKHTGPAATSLGPVPRSPGGTNDTPPPASTNYLLDTLLQAPRLSCRSYDYSSILQLQLEKLAVNAFSNPLTALADSTVEYLFSIPKLRSALMAEISSVILALPELQGVTGVRERFSSKRLDETVMRVIVQNRSTTCSMVWDMRAGRETEIRYINGYWARRGRELGVGTPLNDEIVEKIQAMTAERQSGRR